MPIPIRCDHCGKTMHVPERMAGRRGKCPACGRAIDVPEAPSAPTPPPPAEAAPAAPAAAALSAPATCREHGGKSIGLCSACGAPICLDCRKSFGYFCGAACREKARAESPSDEEQAERSAAKAAAAKADSAWSKGRKILIAAAAAVILLLVVILYAALRSRVAWEVRPGHTFISAVGGPEGLYAVTAAGQVVAIDPRAGAIRWVSGAAGREGRGEAAVPIAPHVGLLLAGTRLLRLAPNAIAALDLATGRPAWSVATPTGREFDFRTGGKDSPLTVFEESLVRIGEEGRPVCMDLETGKTKWTAPPPGFAVDRIAHRGGRIYVAGPPGKVACYAAKDGAALWTWEPGAADESPGRVDRLLPLDDGAVVGAGRRAHRLDAQGARRWSVAAGDPTEDFFCADVAAVGSRVLVSVGYQAVLVDAATGREAWRKYFANGTRVEWTDGRTLLATGFGDVRPSVEKLEGVSGYVRHASNIRGGISTGAERTLFAVDAATGKIRWVHPSGSQILVRDGTAYTVGQEGKVSLVEPVLDRMFRQDLFAAAVDVETGSVRWRWDRANAQAFGALTDRHLVVVGTAAGEDLKSPLVGFVTAIVR